MNPTLKTCLPVVALALLFFPGLASAEIAVLASGQTLSIKAHRAEGDRIILELRGGGEVTCDKNLVEKILADEVPYKDPEQHAAVAETETPLPEAAVVPMSPYGEIITAIAQTNGVDPLLVRALIQVESGDRPTARSNKGA